MILVGQMILLVDGDEEQYITFRSMGKEAYPAGSTSGKDGLPGDE
jgi:hypothetical protein